MRIFFVTSKLKNENTASGSVIELEYMIKELTRLGNEVSVVTVFSRGNDLIKPPPFKLFEEHCVSPHLFPIQWAAYKILKKYEKEADIFHIDAQFIHGGGLYRMLGGIRPIFAYLIRPPLIKENYVSYFFEKRFGKTANWPRFSFWKKLKYYIRFFVERFILNPFFASRVDYVSCLNPLLLKEHYDFGLRRAAYGLIIGDTYPMDDIMKKVGIDEYSYRKRIGRNEKVILYYSGRMAPGKGYDLLLEGFSRVKNKDRFKLILGGNGPEEEMVRETIRDLELEQYVELTGWVSREQMFEYLKKCDAYVFTRWGKTLSTLSLMEAMAFGLPLIVPRGTGLAWTAGKSSITFESENPDDLARQIEHLGSDAELRKELSRQCYERLKQADIDPRQTVVAMNVIMKSLVFSPRGRYPLHPFLQGFRNK